MELVFLTVGSYRGFLATSLVVTSGLYSLVAWSILSLLDLGGIDAVSACYSVQGESTRDFLSETRSSFYELDHVSTVNILV